jgi:hypothetical protein
VHITNSRRFRDRLLFALCAEGSARSKFQEGKQMGSLAAAKSKTEELQRWAEHVGEILSKKAFGEKGPDLETSLADLEELLGPILKQVTAGYLRTAVSEQAERLSDETPCPTCGEGCALTTQDAERQVTTEHGDFRFAERVGHCDRCGRSFFPSADCAED